jgi:triacylglycerol lipase
LGKEARSGSLVGMMSTAPIRVLFVGLIFLCSSCANLKMPHGVALPGPVTNADPMVLIHGFGGWGPKEMFGYRYWGGTDDLEENLNTHGYPTVTAAVGPLSSNWDRACELYAQLIGGRVDYGAAHAKTHSHARFGVTYDKALIPGWGKEAGPKVHLIGHSQGGQTARVLVSLLTLGAPEEMAAADNPSSLFSGGKSWVRSVTSLATPHDGTTLTHVMDDMLSLAKDLIKQVAGHAGIFPDKALFDFKMGQFGLARKPGESFTSYAKRAEKTSVFQTQDHAMWDLSPEGAKELNARYPEAPDVSYLSWSTEATDPQGDKGHHTPEASMFLLFHGQSTDIGKYTSNTKGHVPITPAWFQNDGVVNTRSMAGPTLGTQVAIQTFEGSVTAGIWHSMGVLTSTDHMDVVGVGTSTDIRPWFRRWATFLHRLP